MHHQLKILSSHFEAVIRGQKKFEIRDNSERGFQAGDTVELHEIAFRRSSSNVEYTGRKQLTEITYVTNYNQPENQVVFAFNLVGDVINENSLS